MAEIKQEAEEEIAAEEEQAGGRRFDYDYDYGYYNGDREQLLFGDHHDPGGAEAPGPVAQ